MERRREIGLMRALGATRSDIIRLVLGEAALLGLVGGVMGIASARVFAFIIDLALRAYVPDFQFNPDSYFDFRWWIIVGALCFSVLFSILGGLMPARRAVAVQPAEALSGN
jgi:putative ABC transport system permease protein